MKVGDAKVSVNEEGGKAGDSSAARNRLTGQKLDEEDADAKFTCANR